MGPFWAAFQVRSVLVPEAAWSTGWRRKLPIPGQELVALIVAVSFAAGLNVYATVATLGLLAHAGVLALPPALYLLASWWVIGASLALFAVEFFADKVPAFDLVWNALHTFIRVPVAALIAWRATATLSPQEQLLATCCSAVRSPLLRMEARPQSGPWSRRRQSRFRTCGFRLGEDVVAISLTWLATRHPYAAGGIAGALVLVIVLMIRWVWRALRSLFRGAERELVQGSGVRNQ